MKTVKQKFIAEFLYMCEDAKVDRDWILENDVDFILSVEVTKVF